MTFKELVNELMLQGWRVYHTENMSSSRLNSHLELLANSRLVEIRVYEGRPFIFVKTIFKKLRNDKK